MLTLAGESLEWFCPDCRVNKHGSPKMPESPPVFKAVVDMLSQLKQEIQSTNEVVSKLSQKVEAVNIQKTNTSIKPSYSAMVKQATLTKSTPFNAYNNIAKQTTSSPSNNIKTHHYSTCKCLNTLTKPNL